MAIPTDFIEKAALAKHIWIQEEQISNASQAILSAKETIETIARDREQSGVTEEDVKKLLELLSQLALAGVNA